MRPKTEWWWWCYPILSEGWGMEVLRLSQQPGHDPKFGSEIKDWRSSAKDGAQERLKFGTIQMKMSSILHLIIADAARRILLTFYPAQIRGQKKVMVLVVKLGQVTAGAARKNQFLWGNLAQGLADLVYIGEG